MNGNKTHFFNTATLPLYYESNNADELAEWVYDNCHLGTTVQVYEDANVASPFDKPELVPISDQQTWDPTDPKFN